MMIVNCSPATTPVDGSRTVCVVVPVKTWIGVDAVVKVVVLADVGVVVSAGSAAASLTTDQLLPLDASSIA